MDIRQKQKRQYCAGSGRDAGVAPGDSRGPGGGRCWVAGRELTSPVILVEANDLVDDLDAGVAATLGFPAPGRENQSLARVNWEEATVSPHLIFSGFPPRSVMKSIMSSISASDTRIRSCRFNFNGVYDKWCEDLWLELLVRKQTTVIYLIGRR